MPKISKKRKAALAKHDLSQLYSLKEAMSIVKEVNTAKFDASVDVPVKLGVDPKRQTKVYGVLMVYQMEPVKQKLY